MKDSNSSNEIVILGNDTPNVNVAVSRNDRTLNSPDIIFCSRCGSEMKKTSRYCMKCGNLNYMHPENESMKQYAIKSSKHGEFISGCIDRGEMSVRNDLSLKAVSNDRPYMTCFIVNLVVFALLTLLFMLPILHSDTFSVGFLIPVMILLFFYSYVRQRIFIKCGEPWWSVYVPFYGSYIFFKISMGVGWLFLISFVPIVGSIISLISYYKLGKKFYKNGILTVLFPFIMLPIIAFDKNAEISMFFQKTGLGDEVIDANGKTKTEKEYGRKKFLISVICVVIIVVTLVLGWDYIVSFADKVIEFFKEQLEFYKQ